VKPGLFAAPRRQVLPTRPAPVRSCSRQGQFTAGGSPGSAIWDNLNIKPGAALLSTTATLTANGIKTRPAAATLVTVSTLNADGTVSQFIVLYIHDGAGGLIPVVSYGVHDGAGGLTPVIPKAVM
jgi:hypothetical protein